MSDENTSYFSDVGLDAVQEAIKPPAPWTGVFPFVITSAEKVAAKEDLGKCAYVKVGLHATNPEGKNLKFNDNVLFETANAKVLGAVFLCACGLTPREYADASQLVGLTGNAKLGPTKPNSEGNVYTEVKSYLVPKSS